MIFTLYIGTSIRHDLRGPDRGAATALGGPAPLPALPGRRRLLLVRDRRLQPCDRRLAVRRPHAHISSSTRSEWRSLNAGPAPTSSSTTTATAAARPSSTTPRRSTQLRRPRNDRLSRRLRRDSPKAFVDSFKTELARDRVWRTRTQLELAIVEYVAWFNTKRLHTSLGGILSRATHPPSTDSSKRPNLASPP